MLYHHGLQSYKKGTFSANACIAKYYICQGLQQTQVNFIFANDYVESRL